MRAFWPDPPNPEALQALASRLPNGLALVQHGDYEILIEGRPKPEHISPSLAHLVVPYAGVPSDTLDLLKERPELTGHNLHHNASATAEMAVALLFAAAKRLVPTHNQLAVGDWTSRYRDSESLSLEGKTALVLGYGSIGRRVGRALAALQIRVLGVRKSPPDEPDVFPVSELPQLLPQAQVLVVSLPLTDDTIGLLGERELALLPKGAVLVNVARAAIVVEEALYNALKSGHLHSAGLDVWYSYPRHEGQEEVPASAANTAPSLFPFGELDNVVMSPHVGGATMDTERHRVEHLAALLAAIFRGEDTGSRIRTDAGY